MSNEWTQEKMKDTIAIKQKILLTFEKRVHCASESGNIDLLVLKKTI